MSETYSQLPTTKNDDISFKELIFRIRNVFDLKKKWIIVFVMAAIGGAIGFAYAYKQKPQYVATLTFALEDDKNSGGGLGGALGLASTLGIDLGTGAGGAFSGTNLIELMKSRRLVEQALLKSVTLKNKAESIVELYIEIKGLRNIWQKGSPEINKLLQFPPDADRSKFSLEQDSVLGLIYGDIAQRSLVVEQRDKKVSIISVEVKSESEIFAKVFAEVLAKEVSDFYVDSKSKKAKLNVLILDKQADSIRTELYDAISGVAVANDNTFNLNPALNVKRTSSSKRQVDVQANTAILTELVKNLELAKVTLRKETPLIQVIDTPILPLRKDKASKTKFLLMGGILAGFLSFMMVAAHRWWKNTIN